MELESRTLSSPRGTNPRRSCAIESPPAQADGDKARPSHSVSSSTASHNSRRWKRDTRQVSPFEKETAPCKKRNYSIAEDVVTIYNLPLKLNAIGFCSFVQKTLQEVHGEKVEVRKCQRLPPNGDKLSVLISFENTEHCDLALGLNGVEYFGRTLHATLGDPNSERSKKRLFADERNERHGKLSEKFDYFKMKRLLEEAENDVRCYRQQLESERSSTRRMEDSLHALSCENDDLRRRNHDTKKMRDDIYALQSENENLRQWHYDSKRLEQELGDLRRENDDLRSRSHDNKIMKDELYALQSENGRLRQRQYESSRLEQELDELRRENDDLRSGYSDTRHSTEYGQRDQGYNSRECFREEKQVVHLRWQLVAVTNERDVLLRDTERLKGQVLDLKSSSAYLKRENEHSSNRRHKEEHNASVAARTDSELQRRLDKSRSENKALNGLLQHTKQQVKGLESQMESIRKDIVNLNTENESLEEEMEQMRMNHAMELGFAGGD